MVVQWLSWIPHLWGQLVCSDTLHKEGFIGRLPDEIIIDILSRLPTNCVLECRKVCKKWLALTSIPYFASKRTAKQDDVFVFYHPLTMESRVLHVHQKANCFQYNILTIGHKLWRKLDLVSYRPKCFATPTIVKRDLYWMVKHTYDNEYNVPPCNNSIMRFNIGTEQFCSKPHPGKECHSRPMHEKMRLLKMGVKLCFGYLDARLIDIWQLEDVKNWLWVKTYKVNLDWDVNCYPFVFSVIDPYYLHFEVKLLKIQNSELLMDWYSRGLFAYHLDLGTIRKIDKARIKRPGWLQCN
ncbi:hypothetical protein LOK49_Contig12G00025 [Camellia lanceoleosa]|nr:hypothetical protein LOK49_Contig12G00025 [Camellia lanceoleosa]